MEVKTIDDWGIKERLRKGEPSLKLNKEALQLIKALENALERQKDLTKLAIKKLRTSVNESMNQLD